MFRLQGRLPRKLYVAVSGGVDSMAVVDFLKRSHDVTALVFDHKTDVPCEDMGKVSSYMEKNSIKMEKDVIKSHRPKSKSQEEHWREERYAFFRKFNDAPVITCHHLDDCVETWIWSSLNGIGKIIPYRNGNIIRPFLLNRKEEFVEWGKRNNVEWFEDPSNEDQKYTRNFIRHTLIPNALKVNPGIYKVVMKKVEAAYKEYQTMIEEKEIA